MVNIRFKNAFSEVYEILKYLREDEYNKISEDFLKIVEKYRNKEYEFVLEDNIELKNQKLMTETRAILFNLFYDYFATNEQKELIKRWNREELQKKEQRKREMYDVDVFKKDKVDNSIKQEEIVESRPEEIANEKSLVEYKESIFKIIINKIKAIFGKK